METTSAIVCDPAIVIAEDRTMFYLKAGFHMIADRRSQTIAIDRRRSQKIEHGSIFCDHLRSRSQDRRRSQTLLGSAICDLRSAIIWKPAFSESIVQKNMYFEFLLVTNLHAFPFFTICFPFSIFSSFVLVMIQKLL